ncbi:MAG: S41 family peptidase [Gemmatimonadota bacterium]
MRSTLRVCMALSILPFALAFDVRRSEEDSKGSQTRRESLAAIQIDNLVLLGKVWGFAKYHHPRITGGGVDWDAELRRVLPTVLAANQRTSAIAAITQWLEPFDRFDACSPCASLPPDLHLKPDIDWIRDDRTVGRELSRLLVHIYDNRSASAAQQYVSFTPVAGNPVFRNEADYASTPLPDEQLRVLALFRFWNMIEYWFPYRDLIEEDWDGVLRAFVPRLWNTSSAADYRLTMMALIARIHDGHANLWNALAVRPPVGVYVLPVSIRFIDGKAVVAGFSNNTQGVIGGLQLGDVITAIDGKKVDSLVTAWTPHYAASNQAARLRDIGRALTFGPAGLVRVDASRGGRAFVVQAARVLHIQGDRTVRLPRDLPGPAFQRLTDEVAYLKLSAVSAAQTATYINDAAGAKVLVIDIRNYPSEFVVFALGQHLVAAPTPFARFTKANGANPGAFAWTQPVSLTPSAPRFTGSIVILVDETSQSQAEYTAMAFRSAPNAIVVGSTTAGADGNVSPIMLPGGLRSMISGIGVFYPDRTPTQRVGIKPDFVVRPTIEGVQRGRDELLEAAVSRALGREFRLQRPLQSR